MSKIYRKASLEKLSSPEQLDNLIKITSPSYWLTLVGGITIIIGVVIWAFYGQLPKMLNSNGILLHNVINDGANIKKEVSDIKDMNIVSYIPLSEGKKVTKGMEAYVIPSNISEQEYGHIKGIVEDISTYVISSEEMLETLGNESLVAAFQQLGPVLEIKINLLKDEESINGFKWSNSKGNKLVVSESTFVTIRILLESESPISKIIPSLVSSIN